MSSANFDNTSEINVENLTMVLMRNKPYLLWVMNEKLYFDRFLLATIYIGICSILGTAGNGIVVCVYNFRRQRNTANVFIFFLGIVDLLLCAIVMPFKLFDMRYPLMYGLPYLCTCYHFVEITLSMVSVAFMICIAVDRYLIITRPLNRKNFTRVYKIIAVCVVIGVAASWPTVFIYGKSQVTTNIPEIVGNTCGVSDIMKDKVITQVWYIYLYTVFVVTLVVLVVMYTKIWLLIRKWKDTLIGESATSFAPRHKPFRRGFRESIPSGNDNKNVRINSYIPFSVLITRVRKLSFEDDVISLRDFNTEPEDSTSGSGNSQEDADRRLLSKIKVFRLFAETRRRSSAGAKSVESAGKKRARMRRNTAIFGVISLLFILSYLPCLVVISLRTLHLYKVTNVNQMKAALAEVFVRSGYLSSVLNPYVYSFICPNFRRGVHTLFFR